MTRALGGPPTGGISPGVAGTDDTLVSKAKWNQLAEQRAIVGVCRYPGCGGNLQAVESSAHDHSGEDGQITFYDARCVACHREVTAPNGRFLRRSGLHAEAPRGWWEKREERDAEERRARNRTP